MTTEPETPPGFITLPPGMFDSGTFTVPAPRAPSRGPEPTLNDIVFVPTVLGAAPALPAPAQPVPVQPVPAQPVPVQPLPAEPDTDATVVSVSRAATPSWRLVLPGGATAVNVTGTVLIGRNPAASALWPTARLVAVADPSKSVSKTHAALELENGELWVHDLNSTNGVAVVTAGDATEVRAGERTLVPAGSDLELGRFVIQVERG